MDEKQTEINVAVEASIGDREMGRESKYQALLLVAIDKAEEAMNAARGKMVELQHDYLIHAGFIPEAYDDDFMGGNMYSRDGQLFLDADHAMEYAMEQMDINGMRVE